MSAAYSRKSAGGFRRQRKKSVNAIPRAFGALAITAAASGMVYLLFRAFQQSAFLPANLKLVLDALCVILWLCAAILFLTYISDLFGR